MTDPNTLGVNKRQLCELMNQRDELVQEIDACTKDMDLLRLASLLLSFTPMTHIEQSLLALPGRNGRMGDVCAFSVNSPERRHMAAYQYADAMRGAPRLYAISVMTSFLGVDQLALALKYIRKGEGHTGIDLL
jgi:hypothetical protein